MKVGDTVDGRYKLLELLGEGAAGKVFRAEDRGRNQMFVAVKLLHAKDPRWEGFFRREFEVLSRLHHANLVRVFDFGPAPDESTFYFTQELVVGSPLLDVVYGKRIDEVCGLFIEICRALEFIHAHNVLHRDLKPANILVQRHAEPGERVRVLDFGLWRELDPTPQKGARWAGTPPYLASEVLRGFGHSICADLYAVGVTLFQAITRKLPHGRGTPQELLAARKEPAHTLKGVVPDALADLVARLLDEEPSQRPQTAAEVAERLSLFVPNHTLTMPLQLGRARLVGRDQERKRIEEIIASVSAKKTDATRLIIVRGARGVGKSRLASEIKAHAQLNGSRSAIGRALENVRAPYRPIAELIRAFTPATEAVGLSVDDRAVVERLCPELSGDPMSVDLHVTDDERPRFHSAVADFFVRLAKKEPLVLIIEDAHFLDVNTVTLLSTIQKRASEAPILLVVTASTDVGAPGLQRELVTSSQGRNTVIELGPLLREDCGRLTAALLGVVDAPEAVLDAVMAHADGNPLLIEDLLATFIDRGDLVRGEGGWNIDAFLKSAHVPGPLPSAVAERLARLPEEEQCALSALAVFNRPATAKILGAISGLDPNETRTAILNAQSADLIKTVDDDLVRPRYVFRHPHIREVLLKDLADGEVLKEWHVTTAEVLEERARRNPNALAAIVAHHYAEGDENARALLWMKRAINHAIQTGEHDQAIELSRRAIRLARQLNDDKEMVSAVDALHGQALIVAGRVAEARFFLDEAVARADLSSSPEAAGRVYLHFARACHLAGALAHGRRVVDAAQSEMTPQSSPGATARLLLARAELTRRHDPARAIDDAERALALFGDDVDADDEAAALEVLTAAYRANGNLSRALDVANRRDARAQSSDNIAIEIAAKRDLALITNAVGDRISGRNHLNIAHQLAREHGFPVEEAMLARALGEQLYVSGAYSEAIGRFQQAATQFAQMGVEIERAESIRSLALCYAGKGDYPRAVDHFRAALGTFDRTNASVLRVSTRARLAEALVAKTEHDEAQRVIDEAATLLPATSADAARAELEIARGVLAIARGDFESARRGFLKGAVSARRARERLALGEAVTGYAQALLREKKPQRASRMVKKAETIFIDLDARGQLRRIAPLINAAEGLSQPTKAKKKSRPPAR